VLKKLFDSKKSHPKAFSLGATSARTVVFISTFLFLLVFWTFFPATQNGFLYYDENAFILKNSHVSTGLNWANFRWTFLSLENANWYPLTWLSHMLDVQLHGLRAGGHHLTNVLLHGLNTVLVFLLFRYLTGNGWRSAVLALLFGLHPLRVESVAWVSERKDVLSTLFWLLAMWVYLRFAEVAKKPDAVAKLFYALSLLLFLMGLMSKTMVVTLPFVLLLLDYWPLQRIQRTGVKFRTLIVEKVPFFALAIAVSAIEYVAQRRFGAFNELNLSLMDRLENVPVSYVRYVIKFFWPENLSILYPHPGHWPLMAVGLATLVVVVASVAIWKQRKQAPYLFFGWFWFIGTFVPVINLVQLGSQSIADRYTYVPMIGFAFLLVWGICELSARWPYRFIVLTALSLGVITVCLSLTRYELKFWKDDLTLWNRALAVTKNNYAAENYMGMLLRDGRPNDAFVHFQKAVRINPNYADAQRNLAGQLFDLGRFEEAAAHYQKSLELDPVCAWAETGLGLALYKAGRLDEYLSHLEKGVQYEPDNASRQHVLGVALYEKQKPMEAILHLRQAVRLEPNNAKYHTALGVALLEQGHLDEAIAFLQIALHNDPENQDAKRSLEMAIELQQQKHANDRP